MGTTTQYINPTTTATNLVGCSQAGSVCAAGFLAVFVGTAQQAGCVDSCPPGSPLALYNTAGVQTGCGTTVTCSSAPYAGGVAVKDSDGVNPTGCMLPGATSCPSLGANTFSMFTGGVLPSTYLTLSQCWTDANNALTCDGLPGGLPLVEIAATSAAITNIAGGNPLRGCTPVAQLCPAYAKHFLAPADGTLVTGSTCLIQAPTCTCIVSVVDASSPISSGNTIGCLGTGPGLALGTACPTQVLYIGDFSFEVVTGSTIPAGAAQDTVVQCLRASPTPNCGTTVTLRDISVTPAVNTGCLINLPTPAVCPSTGVASLRVFPSYGPNTNTDGTPRLECAAKILEPALLPTPCLSPTRIWDRSPPEEL
jgi:hypothetical protein